MKVVQSHRTLCDPMDYIVHGILQARILEWVAFPFSKGSSQPRDQTQVSCIAGGFFPDRSVGKESAWNAGDPGLIPGLRRFSGEGIGYPVQYSWASLVAQLVKNLLPCGRPGFYPWVGKIPWRRERLLTPVFWPREFHGLYSLWGRKELDTTKWLSLSLLYLFKGTRGLLSIWNEI